MDNVINLNSWTPYIPPQYPIQQLNEAIECLLASWIANTDFILSSVNLTTLPENSSKKDIMNTTIAKERIQFFLSKTRITANLLSGNYEAGLKMMAPIVHDGNRLFSDLPYRNMIIALLARLKKQNKVKWQMHYSNQYEIDLNTMVDSFISDDGSSPNDAIRIPPPKTSSLTQKIA